MSRAARVLRSPWLAAALVAVLCLLIGQWVLARPGVFQAQVNVVMLPPGGPDQINAISYRPAKVVDFAGIVAKAVAGSDSQETAGQGVTLASQGIYHGWSVQHPNVGGQWVYSFNRPVIEVQATGSSAEEVRSELVGVIDRINADIAQRQTGVDVENQVRTILSPAQPSVFYSDGARSRAQIGIVAVTAVLSVLTVSLLRLRSRREVSETTPAAEGRHPALV